MNSNYQADIFYAKEKINAQLKAAELHRLARQANSDSKIQATTGRAYGWVGRASSQLARLLEALGEARVASLQRQE